MRRRNSTYPNPIRRGSKGDDEYYLNWWLFSPPLNKDQIDDFLDDYDICPYYSGSGQSYTRKPSIEHSKSYTLIVQCGGLDI